MHELIASQRAYFLSGQTLPPAIRKRTLKKLHDLILDHEQFLAEAIYRDFRKSHYLTVENELSIPCGEINRAVRSLDRWTRSSPHRTNLVNFPARSESVPVPYGVALVIAPWNYPYMLSLVPLISAIAAGNTVVLKPSEVTSNASGALAGLLNRSFPKELIHVVEGGPEETAELLKERFDKIFFTGSTGTGRIVMDAAASHLTPVTLELGGKNPVIVFPDCRIRRTARRLVWGKFHNNGAACVSPDHVYVHESVKEVLLKEMCRYIREIYGEDPRKSPVLPRLVNRAHYDRIMSMIGRARVVAGGRGEEGDLYVEPTILELGISGEPFPGEEVFGPVMPVLGYSDLNSLLSELKKKPTPLALYLFTRDLGKARRIMREIPSGGGMINDVVLQFINMNSPFGGMGESGMGTYHGKAGFDAFSHYKTVLTKPYWFDLFLKYPPYRKMNLRILRSVLGRSVRNFWRNSGKRSG